MLNRERGGKNARRRGGMYLDVKVFFSREKR